MQEKKKNKHKPFPVNTPLAETHFCKSTDEICKAKIHSRGREGVVLSCNWPRSNSACVPLVRGARHPSHLPSRKAPSKRAAISNHLLTSSVRNKHWGLPGRGFSPGSLCRQPLSEFWTQLLMFSQFGSIWYYILSCYSSCNNQTSLFALWLFFCQHSSTVSFLLFKK